MGCAQLRASPGGAPGCRCHCHNLWQQMPALKQAGELITLENTAGKTREGSALRQLQGHTDAWVSRRWGRWGAAAWGCCCPAWAETCSAGAAGSSFGDLLSIMPCLAYEHVHCCRYVHTLTFVHTHSCSHIQTHFIHINTHMDVCACSCPWKLCLQAWGCSCALSSQDPTNLHAAWQLPA